MLLYHYGEYSNKDISNQLISSIKYFDNNFLNVFKCMEMCELLLLMKLINIYCLHIKCVFTIFS